MPFLLRPLCSLVFLSLLQTPVALPAPQTAVKPPLAWASVSIHVSDPARDADYTNDQANGTTDRGLNLREIISQAYNFSVMPFREEEISGLPDWARSTRYDIVARVDPDDVEAFKKLSNLSLQDTMTAYAARQPTGEMLMMQSLLQERFHLQVHWELKERSVYSMTVAKDGLRMKPAADPEHGDMNSSRGHLSGKGVPLSFFASLLARPVDRIVIDNTGMRGVYDFDLHYAPRDSSPEAETNDADLFTALQEQLGLKLQSVRASVPVLVVDHVETPTPN